MLEAHIHNGSLLKRVFDAIKDMVAEVNLECSENGIQLQAMDSSHVSLVSLDLKVKAFDFFRCDRACCLGLNMAALAKAFRLCGNDDKVVIRHEDDAEIVSFVFESEGRVSDFDLKLMQIDQERLEVPETQFSALVNIPSKQFQRICVDLGHFSDTLAIESCGKVVKFSSKGDIIEGKITLGPCSTDEGEVSIEMDSDKPIALLFAVRYLNYFAKATPLAKQVQLQFSPFQPLEITFHLIDNPELGRLRFYLAPKLNDDEANTQSQDA